VKTRTAAAVRRSGRRERLFVVISGLQLVAPRQIEVNEFLLVRLAFALGVAGAGAEHADVLVVLGAGLDGFVPSFEAVLQTKGAIPIEVAFLKGAGGADELLESERLAHGVGVPRVDPLARGNGAGCVQGRLREAGNQDADRQADDEPFHP